MYGARSSTRSRRTDAYTVVSSNRDASSCVTLLHAVTPGGVMAFQCPPPSRVTHSLPSSVPAHSVRVVVYDGASAYTAPRCFSCSFAPSSPFVGGLFVLGWL